METKSYESISFEVESELSKPKKFLATEEVNNILSFIFKRFESERSSFDACKCIKKNETMKKIQNKQLNNKFITN